MGSRGKKAICRPSGVSSLLALIASSSHNVLSAEITWPTSAFLGHYTDDDMLTQVAIRQVHQIQIFQILAQTFELQHARSQADTHDFWLRCEHHLVISGFGIKSEAHAWTLKKCKQTGKRSSVEMTLPPVLHVPYVAWLMI